MQNKKMILVLGILILVVGATAFIAVRMFNIAVHPIHADGPVRGDAEFTFSSSNNITPAPELPTTRPEVIGFYLEMRDHTMIIRAVSFDPGIGGILGDSVDVNSAPKVERIKEQIMQNKKLIFIMGGLVLLVGAAAFLAGRML